MPASRRSRFTAELSRAGSAPVQPVILAYSAAQVVSHYESRGYRVHSVVKGDLRRQARKQEVKRSGGFKVDQQALNRAIQTLGLTLPVRLRFNSRVGNTNGNYRFRGSYHDIMLKSYRTPEQASSTLWHELTHAMQAEKAGSLEAWALLQAKSRGLYRNCPREIEARSMSRQMADTPLCK